MPDFPPYGDNKGLIVSLNLGWTPRDGTQRKVSDIIGGHREADRTTLLWL